MKYQMIMKAYKNNIIVEKKAQETSLIYVDNSSENKGVILSVGEDVKTLKNGDTIYWKGDHHVKLGDKIIMEDSYVIAYEEMGGTKKS